MFIAWCAEISTLSRSTFQQWIWIEAKKWLSFAFISSLDAFSSCSFKFTFFLVRLCKFSRCWFFYFIGATAHELLPDFWHSRRIHSSQCLPHLRKTFFFINIDWTMHKNEYNFFIIFQYFPAFYGRFNAKFMLFEHRQRWAHSHLRINSSMQWLRNTTRLNDEKWKIQTMCIRSIVHTLCISACNNVYYDSARWPRRTES